MQSQLLNTVYNAAFFRACRSVQLGLRPSWQDVERAVEQGWDDVLDSTQPPRRSLLELEPMAEADKLSAVQHWLYETQGWLRVRAGYEAGRPYEEKGILLLASLSSWVNLAPMPQLLHVQQGKMHPICLEVGWGSRQAAYSNVSTTAKVYFFNAYHVSLERVKPAEIHSLAF